VARLILQQVLSLMLSSPLHRVGSIERGEECTPGKRGAQLMSLAAGALLSWPRLPSRSRLEPLFDRPGFSARCNQAFSREPLVMRCTSNCGRFPSQLSSSLEPKTFTNLTWSGRGTNCHVPLFNCLPIPCNPLFLGDLEACRQVALAFIYPPSGRKARTRAFSI
jgi:hypothetical protein